jgi:hypothetical protein
MTNIYEGCLNNQEILYWVTFEERDAQLNKRKAELEAQGYKVVFVFGNYFTRVVLYDKDALLPEPMRSYLHKYIHFNGRWELQSMLGVCCRCGEFKVITTLDKDGWKCDDCAEEGI